MFSRCLQWNITMQHTTQMILIGLSMMSMPSHHPFASGTEPAEQLGVARFVSCYNNLQQADKDYMIENFPAIFNRTFQSINDPKQQDTKAVASPKLSNADTASAESREPVYTPTAENTQNQIGDNPARIEATPRFRRAISEVKQGIDQTKSVFMKGRTISHVLTSRSIGDRKSAVASEESVEQRSAPRQQKLERSSTELEFDFGDEDDNDNDEQSDGITIGSTEKMTESSMDLEEVHEMFVKHFGRMGPGNLARLLDKLYSAANLEESDSRKTE